MDIYESTYKYIKSRKIDFFKILNDGKIELFLKNGENIMIDNEFKKYYNVKLEFNDSGKSKCKIELYKCKDKL